MRSSVVVVAGTSWIPNSPILLTTWLACYPRRLPIVLLVYSLGFLVSTYTHTKGILAHGFLPFPVPFAVGLYWEALTVLDPLTVLLLLWGRPKVGLWLAVTIMGSDISVNTLVYLVGYLGPPTAQMVPLSLFEQSLFGLFVFLTAPLAYFSLIKQEQHSTSC